MPRTTSARIRASRGGFSLVELMISIALALLLIVGINQVFKYTAATAGATQAVSDGLRNSRSAQSVFYRDFSNMVTADAPAIIINSNQVFAFRGLEDARADADALPNTADLDAAGTEIPLLAANYNSRSHRTDIMSFFIRDLMRRSTGGTVPSGGTSPIVSSLTGNDGWIWYGHLWQPNSAFVYDNSANPSSTLPGAGTATDNPFNYHAANWTLGRMAMVLKEKSATTGTIPEPAAGPAEWFLNAFSPPASRIDWLNPLSFGSQAYNGVTPIAGTTIQSSRLDLAGTSVNDFRGRLQSFIDVGRASAIPNDDWSPGLMGSNANRFQTHPYLVKPISPASYAKQAPQFISNCTQFIVEYAGDFMNQADDGTVLGVGSYAYKNTAGIVTHEQNPFGTDGKTDYVWVGPTGNRTRQIRWYGMPRDVASLANSLPDGIIAGYPTPAVNQVDVVPVRDVIQAFVESSGVVPGGSTFTGASFERIYGTNMRTRANYLNPTTAMPANETYTAAWGPEDISKPSMIRLTIVIDDPSGRIAEGQSFEYVFKVQ